jgi:hypothetical protein
MLSHFKNNCKSFLKDIFAIFEKTLNNQKLRISCLVFLQVERYNDDYKELIYRECVTSKPGNPGFCFIDRHANPRMCPCDGRKLAWR